MTPARLTKERASATGRRARLEPNTEFQELKKAIPQLYWPLANVNTDEPRNIPWSGDVGKAVGEIRRLDIEGEARPTAKPAFVRRQGIVY